MIDGDGDDDDGDQDDVRNNGMLISCMLIDPFF